MIEESRATAVAVAPVGYAWARSRTSATYGFAVQTISPPFLYAQDSGGLDELSLPFAARLADFAVAVP